MWVGGSDTQLPRRTVENTNKINRAHNCFTFHNDDNGRYGRGLQYKREWVDRQKETTVDEGCTNIKPVNE